MTKAKRSKCQGCPSGLFLTAIFYANGPAGQLPLWPWAPLICTDFDPMKACFYEAHYYLGSAIWLNLTNYRKSSNLHFCVFLCSSALCDAWSSAVCRTRCKTLLCNWNSPCWTNMARFMIQTSTMTHTQLLWQPRAAGAHSAVISHNSPRYIWPKLIKYLPKEKLSTVSRVPVKPLWQLNKIQKSSLCHPFL